MSKKNNERTNKKIFSEIYMNKSWGGGYDAEPFFSGSGSHTKYIIEPYMNLLAQLIVHNNIHAITEVGCGDFWIMRHVLDFLMKNKYPFSYHGVDVVEELIKYNNKHFANDNVKFSCMDASHDDYLPDGDLIIIRQVLQHLNNADIQKILRKTKLFKFAFITEHIYEGAGVVYNIDKPSNMFNRVGYRSGVYLEQPPYNYQNMVHLLKVEEGGGIIRSSLIINL